MMMYTTVDDVTNGNAAFNFATSEKGLSLN